MKPTRERYNALAAANELTEKRRTDLITGDGAKEIADAEEKARARKSIHLMLTLMAEEHPHIKELPAYKEAIEWYETFENIKADVDDELGIKEGGI